VLVALLAVQALPLLARVDDPVRPYEDVLRYDFSIVVPENGDRIAARAIVRFRVLVADRALVLDLDNALTVEQVLANGRLVPYQHQGDSLLIEHWGAVGDTLDVAIHYTGVPSDGLLLGPTARGPRAAFADNWPDRARRWLPVNDHPRDKAAVSWDVEVPPGWRVVANGVERGSEGDSDGHRHWRFEELHPLPSYTYVIGAGPLAVGPPADDGALPQQLWTYPEDSAFAVTGPFRRAGEIVRVLQAVLGAFPYRQLAHVESRTRFGGMENAGAIFYAEDGYVERTMTERVVVHETAHQWFGDAVTPRDWHHLWLSEGLATYLDAFFYDLVGEHETFRESMASKRERYLGSRVVNRPILDFDEHRPMALLSANAYQKAAWVLHMLRRELGDSAFIAGLRAYYDRYRDSTAVSADFVAVMEEVSGQQLETFFTQWLTQPGYPKLEVAVQRLGRREGRLEIEQVQPEGWGLFNLPVRVDAIATASGRRSSVTLRMRSREASVFFALPEGADSIAVDPAGDALATARTRWK